MADRYPLVVNSSTSKIQELPAGNNLNLHNNGIVNAGNITAAGVRWSNSCTSRP